MSVLQYLKLRIVVVVKAEECECFEGNVQVSETFFEMCESSANTVGTPQERSELQVRRPFQELQVNPNFIPRLNLQLFQFAAVQF